MTRVTRGLLAFALANAFLVNAALWFFSPPGFKDTVLRHTRDTLLMRSHGDSWKPMVIAQGYFESRGKGPMYSEILIKQGIKFQYPPSALLVLKAVRWIDRVTAAKLPIRDILGLAFIAVMAVATAGILNRGLSSGPAPRPEKAARAALAVFLTVTFYPVLKGFTLGQIQVWINSLFAVLLWCWMTDRKAAAGVLTGLICLVKPQYSLILVWALLKRQWRFAAACAITGAVGLAVSVSVFGLENHFDYLKALSFMSRHGEAFFPNQSVNGLMNRLWSIKYPDLYNNLEWRGRVFPPFNPWVYGVTLASSAALVLLALLHPRARAGTPGLCIIALTATMASPIAWEHHYGMLLPLYAVLLSALARSGRAAGKLALLGVSYILASNFIPATNLLAATPLNPLQSHLFAAALVALILLYGLNDARDEQTG